MIRRQFLLSVACATLSNRSFADDAAWVALKKPGAIVLFRHALAPGVGDPPGFKAGDCSTQRNLSEEGTLQARRIGQTLRERGVKIQAVWHSEWCRTRDTAQLAFPELREPEQRGLEQRGLEQRMLRLRAEPAFNSFFGDRSTESSQTAAARKLLLQWRGPGALVVVTHQVNITAITGIARPSGEGVVLLHEGGQLRIAGQIAP